MQRFYFQLIFLFFFVFEVFGQTSLRYGQTFDLLTSEPVQTSIFAPSNKTKSLQDIVFRPDGTTFFVAASDLNAILQYSVSEPFELNSQVLLEGNLDFSTNGGITSMAFNNDGSKIFRIATERDGFSSFTTFVEEFALEVPYDVTTASADPKRLNFGEEALFSEGLKFNNTGDRMYLLSTESDAIFTYSLASPFDISSENQLIHTFNTPDILNAGFNFNPSGTILYITNAGVTAEVKQYELTEAYDLSTAMLDGVFAADVQFFPTDVSFDSDGKRMFLSGGGKVWQFQINGSFIEAASNIGQVQGEARISIDGDGGFAKASQDLEYGVDYTIDNLPNGLQSTLSISSDGSFATLILNGTAVEREDLNDISSLVFSFESSAFDGNVLVPVGNSTGAESGFIIDFRDNNLPVIVNPPVDLKFASGFGIYSIDPAGIASDEDDQKITYSVNSSSEGVATAQVIENMIVLTEQAVGSSEVTITATDEEGASVSSIFNISISNPFLSYQEPFDLLPGQLVFTGDLDLSKVTGAVEAITFDKLGTRLFIMFSSTLGYTIQEYQLSNSFDLNGIVSLMSETDLNFLNGSSDPVDIGFNPSGSRLFITTREGNLVEQFDLSAPYDLTSPVSAGTFFLESTPNEIATGSSFSSDGSTLLISYSGGNVETYSLTEAYNITAELTLESTVSISESLAGPLKLVFSDDGLSMFGTNFGTLASFELTEAFKPGSGISLKNTQRIFGRGFTPRFLALSDDGNRLFTGGIENVSQFEMPAAFVLKENTVHEEVSILLEDEFVNDPGPILFNPDGSKFYMLEGQALYQYLLVVPFDLTAGLLEERRTSTSLRSAEDFSFSPDGTKLFLTGSSTGVVNDFVEQYSLSEPFDISSTVDKEGEFSLRLNLNIPTSHAFSKDGKRLLIADIQTNRINQYQLSNPFDITSGVSFDMDRNVSLGDVSGMEFSADGKKLLLIAGRGSGVAVYSLGEAFDLNGAFTYEGYLDLDFSDTRQKDLTFNESGSRLYVSLLGDRTIKQYHIGGLFDENPQNDGSLIEELKIVIEGAFFSTEKDELENGVDYSISNLPSGLEPRISVNSGSKSVNLVLEGTTESNADTDDISDLFVNFSNSAFSDVAANDIADNTLGELSFSIDFFDSLSVPSIEVPVLSVEEQEGLFVFPNPTSERLNLVLTPALSDDKVTIVMYSLDGQVVKVKEMFSNAYQSQRNGSLDVSDLMVGTYFIQITQAGVRKVVKFVKN